MCVSEWRRDERCLSVEGEGVCVKKEVICVKVLKRREICMNVYSLMYGGAI